MGENKKLILVFYINVSRIYEGDVPAYMNDVAKALSKDSDNTEKYFIPVYESESRVECLNPMVLNEDEYAEVKRKLDKIDEIYKDLLKENK